MLIDWEQGDDDHSPRANHLWTGGDVEAPVCLRAQAGALLTGAGAATTPQVYIVNAQADQSLADEVAVRLIDWGMALSGAGLPAREGASGTATPADRLRTASVVVVLLTAKSMMDRALQHDAATAVAQARLDPGKVIVPVLLDRDADPDASFAGHPWLVPSSHRADDVARAVFEAVHLTPEYRLRGGRASTVSEPGLQTASIAEVSAAIAGTQARRRALVAAVAILVLANLALVALAVASHGDNMAQLLLTMISPLLTFVGVALGFSLGRLELAYRRSSDRR